MRKPPKYRLKNDVIITVKSKGLSIDKNNFCDDYAEIILGDPRLAADYGHNIEILDKSALKLLQRRMDQQNQAARPKEDIVIEVEIDEPGQEPKPENEIVRRRMNSRKTLKAIRGARTSEEVESIVEGDERSSVIKAAERKLKSFTDPA